MKAYFVRNIKGGDSTFNNDVFLEDIGIKKMIKRVFEANKVLYNKNNNSYKVIKDNKIWLVLPYLTK